MKPRDGQVRARLAAAMLVAVSACGGGPTGPSENNPYQLMSGAAVLSASPIDPEFIRATSPLGMLSPPAHTLPTDHVYITFVDAFSGNQQSDDCSRRPIYAAGGGVVTFVLVTEAAGDTKVDVQMTPTFHYYYDHVLLLPGITIGTRVTAGQQIATTTGRCPSFDIGAYDLDVTLRGLVNPARYGPSTRHAVSPYRYFTESLRSLYLSRSRVFEGVPTDPDGRIDFGVAGRLVGDWFHSSLPVDFNSAGSPNGWSKSIAFAYDWHNGTPRISVGGTIANPFVGSIGASDPDPGTVSMSNGMVVYGIRLSNASSMHGWLLVQMTAADRIRVEFFPASAPRPTAFTGAAHDYLR